MRTNVQDLSKSDFVIRNDWMGAPLKYIISYTTISMLLHISLVYCGRMGRHGQFKRGLRVGLLASIPMRMQ
jgi:hypothetical protein